MQIGYKKVVYRVENINILSTILYHKRRVISNKENTGDTCAEDKMYDKQDDKTGNKTVVRTKIKKGGGQVKTDTLIVAILHRIRYN